MKAIILAGGLGKRLAPYTTVIPKPLMPVGHMPILEILIRRLACQGIKDIVLCVGYLSNLIQAYFGNGQSFGVRIEYSLEREPLGTAGPIRLLGDRLPAEFLVMNGDLLTTFDFAGLMEAHKEHGSDLTIGAYKKDIKVDLGILKIENDNLVEYIEKPTLHHWVSMGIYMMTKRVAKLIPEKKFDLPDLVRLVMANEQKIHVYKEPCIWLDIGHQDDYEYANQTYGEGLDIFFKEVSDVQR